MKKIAVVTGTRAEYGLLKNIIKEIDNSEKLELQLIITGTHLHIEYGQTINEIKADGFHNYKTLDILLKIQEKNRLAKEISRAIDGFSELFLELKPDILLILGDRYEIFAAATTAMTMNIPIAHIAGGEVTEGAVDDQIRHAITKMAHIHFPGADEYEKNIFNMGEESWRIFNVGDSGIENIKLTKLMDKSELENDLEFIVDENTILVTYHPVTLEVEKTQWQIINLLKAIDKFKEKRFLITYPNSDTGSEVIIKEIESYAKTNENIKVIKSLGSLRYLSFMKLCGAIIGNSSSALIEAPYFKKPVVNIGNRQTGRLKADNIIDSNYDEASIIKAIKQAISTEFLKKVELTKSLYGEGNTSREIRRVLEEIDLSNNLIKKKLNWRE